MRQKVGRYPPPTDADVAAGRLRTPLVHLAELEGCPILAIDPDGRLDSRDDLEAVLSTFVYAARQAQRDRIVADIATLPRARVAARWALSVATVDRYREEARHRLLVVRSAETAGFADGGTQRRPEDSFTGATARSGPAPAVRARTG